MGALEGWCRPVNWLVTGGHPESLSWRAERSSAPRESPDRNG